MINIPIYLVSLKDDIKRRKELEKRFPKYYSSFIHIEAVDGRKLYAKEYFDATSSFFNKHKRPMSPSELGCTLSHIKALEQFLSTDESFALILDEDIIVDNSMLIFINFLKDIGVNKISLAGFDGFSMEEENYFDNSFEHDSNKEHIFNINQAIKNKMKSFSKTININYLTLSQYK